MTNIPALTDMAAPYLAGVLHGDAWCTDLSLGLRVKDADFVEAFTVALAAATKVEATARLDERGYWLCRLKNRSGRFNHLRHYEPRDNDELGWWLRGLFDSEGNAYCRRIPSKPNSNDRRIAIYSTSTETLAQAGEYLDWLEISHSLRSMKLTAGHKGSKPVYELRVLRRDGFNRFATFVGTSIMRKAEAIRQIVDSYQSDGWQARNWQLAVEARYGRRAAR